MSTIPEFEKTVWTFLGVEGVVNSFDFQGKILRSKGNIIMDSSVDISLPKLHVLSEIIDYSKTSTYAGVSNSNKDGTIPTTESSSPIAVRIGSYLMNLMDFL